LLRAGAAALALAFASGTAAAAEDSLYGRLTPDNIGTYGGEVDSLYRVILWLVLGTFVLTEGLLFWFIFRYRATPGGKAVYTHGNHRLEMIWTLVPGAILFWLALYQMSTWKDIKIRKPEPSKRLVVQVLARQFEWHFRYAGPDGKFHSGDDITSTVLHVPVDTDVMVLLRSQDVLHSFFLPHVRLKQDTVPGLTISQWFRIMPGNTTDEARAKYRAALEADKAGTLAKVARDLKRQIRDQLQTAQQPLSGVDAEYAKAIAEKSLEARVQEWIAAKVAAYDYEIACAELCGIGHTKMRGVMRVHSQEGFWKWLDGAYVSEVLEYGTDQNSPIYKYWPKDQNGVEDEWVRSSWPAELKSKWPQKK
jgi:heme/copper-type cytochrome/quinol oxidase subunit 2